MAIQRNNPKQEVNLELLLKTFEDGFNGVKSRLESLEKKALENEYFQENQVNHYKIRLQNQDDMKSDIKEIKNAVISTSYNDGGLINKVKLNTSKLQSHSITLEKHNAFFVILGAVLLVIGGAVASIVFK